MHLVGQDEVVILLELDESNQLPKDIFIHLNEIYHDADKGILMQTQSIFEIWLKNASMYYLCRSSDHRVGIFNGERNTISRIKRAWWLSIYSYHISVHAKHHDSREPIFNWHFDTSMGSSMG